MAGTFQRSSQRRVCLILVLFACLLPVASWAQEASILGQVTDETGATLPGVTVTATSPALQVPSVIDVTNERGEYRLSPLPIGTYAIEFALQGFQTLRRGDIRLTLGFQARLDLKMSVGSIAETVTVSGATPVVDVTSTTSRTQLTRETLEIVPTGRNSIVALMLQAPGTRPQLEWSFVTGNPFFKTFGQLGESWTALEGVVTTGPKTGTQGGNHEDYSAIEEASVQTVGNNADSPTHGIQINVILKGGGNDFHGSGFFSATGHRLESSNVDAQLISQGITAGNPVNTRWDLSAELGGRIVRDKFWFYYSTRRREEQTGILGAFKDDGSQATSEQYQYFHTAKLSYQMNAVNRLVGTVQYVRQGGVTAVGAGAITRLTSWDNRQYSPTQATTSKVEWQAVKGNKFLSLQVGAWIWNVVRFCYSDNPATLDLITLRTTGCSINYGIDSFEGRNHTKGTFSWYKGDWLGGNHDLKLGFDFAAAHADRRISSRVALPGGVTGFPTTDAVGNYQLIYRNGVPFQIAAYSNSYVYGQPDSEPKDLSHYLPIYFQDGWTIGRRLTLNLGVRYAHEAGFIPPQCRAAAAPPFDVVYPTQCWPEIEYRTWNPVVPRAHAAYDIGGDGKTVVKGGWGRFAHNWHSDELQIANQNVHLVTRFLWRAPVGSRFFVPGQSNLALDESDFVSQSLFTGSEDGLAGAVPNPNINEPMTNEYHVSVERELLTNFAIRATGIHSDVEIFRVQNNLRPYDAYNIPVTNAIPGPDGAVPAGNPYGTITYYEFSPAYAGRAFQQPMLVNSPDHERYTSFEMAASKRLDRRWSLMASYSTTHVHIPFWQNTAGTGSDFVDPGLQVYLATLDPNAEINTRYDLWEWQGRANGAYFFPGGLLVSANYEARSGRPYGRTMLATGGRQIQSLLVRVEPIGAQRTPTIQLVHVRAEKPFALSKGHKIALRMNIYNLTNSNAALTLTQQSGPSYQVPLTILSPRILEFGVNYTF